MSLLLVATMPERWDFVAFFVYTHTPCAARKASKIFLPKYSGILFTLEVIEEKKIWVIEKTILLDQAEY